MISKYNSFIVDMLLEKAINESFLYYSPNVRKALSRIKGNDIATELLGSEGTDVKPDMTFIDLGKEGYFSFITMRNAKPLIVAKYPNTDWSINIDNKPMPDPETYSNDLHEFDMDSGGSDASGVFTKSRNEVGLGRFVNKLFPGKYNSKQIEEFINSFKAILEKSGEYFDLVEGEDIEFWYKSENYKENSGTLGNSCMAQKRNLFGIYTQNQDVCKMLILKEDDKIIGRSLVWKLASIRRMGEEIENAEYFMDRQYTIKESDVQKFRNYAKEKGWFYKSYNNHHSLGTVTIDGEEKNVKMTIKVATKDYNRYPYMDTFKRYDVNNGILHNDDEQGEEYEGQYILEDTGGGYMEIEGGHYSEWYDRRISDDDAVWSEPLGDYLIRDISIEVTRGHRRRRGWYPEDYDDVFFDEDHEEYFHTDDGVYSDIERRMLFDETAVLVVNEIFEDGDVPSASGQYMYEDDRDIKEIDTDWFWFDKISDKFRDWSDYRYISQKLLIVDYKGDYIPKQFTTETYKIEPRDNAVDITGVEYLTKADSLGLGYNIIESEKRFIDWFTYTETISEYTDILLERLPKLIVRYSDVLNNKGQLQLQFQGEQQQEYRDKISKNIAICQDRLENLEEETWN
jgi:ribosomal protein S18